MLTLPSIVPTDCCIGTSGGVNAWLPAAAVVLEPVDVPHAATRASAGTPSNAPTAVRGDGIVRWLVMLSPRFLRSLPRERSGSRGGTPPRPVGRTLRAEARQRCRSWAATRSGVARHRARRWREWWGRG